MTVSSADFQALKTHGKALAAIFRIADALDNVEAINNLTGEANARLAAAQGEFDKQAKAQAKELDASKADRSRIHQDTATARNDLEMAKTAAKDILGAAREKADKIILAANEKSKAIAEESERSRVDIEALVTDKVNNLSRLNSDVAAKETELAAVEAKIGAARDKIKRMMGE
jgi:cell division septum initiation protein DivIVA